MNRKTKVTKNNFIRLVAQDSDANIKDVRLILNSIINAVGRILENGDSLDITGLGVFYTTDIPEQNAWDGINKTRYIKPAGKRIGFMPAKGLRRAIK